jgi:hypothetical protein
MYLSKFRQFLSGEKVVGPGSISSPTSEIGLYGVVEWGLYISATYSAAPTTPAKVMVSAVSPRAFNFDRGEIPMEEFTLDAPPVIAPQWYFFTVSSCAPHLATVRVGNLDTTVTVTVNHIEAVISQVTDVKPVLEPKEWVQAWGAMM